MGIYLEYVPYHTDNLAMILNIKTLYVSPQFKMDLMVIFTVLYLNISRISPNNPDLVQHGCEKLNKGHFRKTI